MVKFMTTMVLATMLFGASEKPKPTQVKAPLSDAQRLDIAKLLRPVEDGQYGSWIEIEFNDYRIYIDSRVGTIRRFSIGRELTNKDVFSVKTLDQALIDYCNTAFKALQGVLKGG